MKFLHLIWSNLRRKKLRTVLTVLSVLVAFVLYAYLCAIHNAFTQGVSLAGADRLVVRHRVSLTQPLPVSYKGRIASKPGVDAVAHGSWFGGVYQDSRQFFGQVAVEPESYLDLYPEIVLKPEQKEAWLKTRTGAIVGRRLAERFGWKIGDRIPLQPTIWHKKDGSGAWEFDIVGIYDMAKKGGDDYSFFFRYDYLDETREVGEGLVGWYLVRVKDPAQAEQVAQSIDDEFANSPPKPRRRRKGLSCRPSPNRSATSALSCG